MNKTPLLQLSAVCLLLSAGSRGIGQVSPNAEIPDAPVVHVIEPGQNPQAVLDAARPGDRLTFLPGLHEHGLQKHSSLLYVDKSIDIELSAGAVLKLADNQTRLLTQPEITIDHGAVKRLNDFSVRGDYRNSGGRGFFAVRIDGEGLEAEADTFQWAFLKNEPDVRQPLQKKNVPISGDWQELDDGIEIRFGSQVGHNTGSLWILSVGGEESYGIRIGHGTQQDYIENVRIYGKGAIDLNIQNNEQPTEWVKNISSCILIHGRVRSALVEDITMRNAMRTVMAYGEHTGQFLRGGGVEGGESFDAEDISILHTWTRNPSGKAILLGHPSHRGRLSKVRCNFNFMETAATALEPNFNLDQYEVVGNVIKSGGKAVHCWRKSVNGLIKDNVRIDDHTGQPVVIVNSPSAWERSENLVIRDNRNHLSDRLGYFATVSGGIENRALGEYATVSGGRRNIVRGDFAAVTGGLDNSADARASLAHGLGAAATRPAESALASGFFDTPGDAQTSVLVARTTTSSEQETPLKISESELLKLQPNSSVALNVLVVARGADGAQQFGMRLAGFASCTDSEMPEMMIENQRVLHRSHEGLGFRCESADGGIRMLATGLPETAIRWVARVELVEVRF